MSGDWERCLCVLSRVCHHHSLRSHLRRCHGTVLGLHLPPIASRMFGRLAHLLGEELAYHFTLDVLALMLRRSYSEAEPMFGSGTHRDGADASRDVFGGVLLWDASSGQSCPHSVLHIQSCFTVFCHAGTDGSRALQKQLHRRLKRGASFGAASVRSKTPSSQVGAASQPTRRWRRPGLWSSAQRASSSWVVGGGGAAFRIAA